MRPFKKYITSIMAFFTPFTFVKLIQFYSITSLGYSLKIRSYGMREKKIFGYIAVSEYHVISKKEENPSLDTIEFLDTYVYVNNPHWQSSQIIVLLRKYYIVISDKLIDSFWDVFFLLLSVILWELHENPKRKDWVTEKLHWSICVRDITFLTARPSFYVIFAVFFVYVLFLTKWLT